MGIDPGYRTGCKLAAVDERGALLDTSVVFPHEPHHKLDEAKEATRALLEAHQVEAIAREIGAPLVTGKTLQASGDSQRREVAINDLRRHVKTCRGKYGENRPEFGYDLAPWYSLHYSTKL